tara:strand:- start:27865 stop:28185 length:321 start_codon:yes stop_codon:yes gene_type:complete
VWESYHPVAHRRAASDYIGAKLIREYLPISASHLIGNKSYGSDEFRSALRAQGILRVGTETPRSTTARRTIEHATKSKTPGLAARCHPLRSARSHILLCHPYPPQQ